MDLAIVIRTVARLVVSLRRRERVAERTIAVYFDKPAGFQFRAGQTIDVTLIHPSESDAEGNSRTFSIASAPNEPDIMVATRMRGSAFKRVLSTMPLGTAVYVDGPMGSFTLHDDATRPAVCLAGGIGITPFRSMIVDVVSRRTRHELWLFFANREPQDAAFLGELQALASVASGFHLVVTMTAPRESVFPRTSETGHIDSAMIHRHVPEAMAPVYYVAGPPGMVVALHDRLVKAGVSKLDIRAEEFSGY